MTAFYATLTPMLTLFLCIAIGFVTVKTRILPETAGSVLAKLETWVFVPALNFMTMVRFCTVDTISIHAVNIIMASLGVALAMAIAIPLAHVFTKEKRSEYGVYAYALTFANCGYVGDPIVQTMFGDATLAYYKLFCLPLNMVIFTWGISILTPRSAVKGGAWRRLLNAPTVAMLAGMVVGLSGLGTHLPGFLTNTLDSLKACMGPAAMLLAGITIAKYDFFKMLKNKKVYIATALRLTVLPTVIISALFCLKLLGESLFRISIGNDVLFLAFFAFAAPLGMNTVVFPEAYGGNPETGASMAMISHTLCVISIPILYAVMTAIFGTPFA